MSEVKLVYIWNDREVFGDKILARIMMLPARLMLPVCLLNSSQIVPKGSIVQGNIVRRGG